MKPLTIEQLKALEVGDWVWVEWETQDPIDWRYAKQKAYFKIIEPENSDSIRFNNFVPMKYSDYGTKWIAYKNKEQEELEEYKIFRKNGIWKVRKLRASYGTFRMFPSEKGAERCLAELKGEKQ